jgi:hypothetical protein
MKWRVAVEKFKISEIMGNFGDRKCLAERRMSFVVHPDAIFFAHFHFLRLVNINILSPWLLA